MRPLDLIVDAKRRQIPLGDLVRSLRWVVPDWKAAVMLLRLAKYAPDTGVILSVVYEVYEVDDADGLDIPRQVT